MKPAGIPWRRLRRGTLLVGMGLAGLLTTPAAWAGPLLDRLMEARAADQGRGAGSMAALPPGVRLLRDLPYGEDARQRMDVYLPPGPVSGRAPLLFMVHGGGWRVGDKAMVAVVANKLSYWLPRGYILVSANYRLLPATPPLEQARDVAAALARAQALAPSWGGDPAAVVLMGHSAGAHLVALLAADPVFARDAGAQPWLGTIALDSAALDLPGIMAAPHAPLYDRAFGQDPVAWQAVSPYHRLIGATRPLLLVCSSRRALACAQADRFASRVGRLGGRAEVLRQPLSHGEINSRLGEPGAYTAAVEAFVATLGRGS